MPVRLQPPWRRRRRQRHTAPLHVEPLEPRALLAVGPFPGPLVPVTDAEPNDTLDLAQDLGSASGTAGATGAIAAATADVDWYSFTLAGPATVRLETLDKDLGKPLVSALSLFNSDPFNFNDPYNP